jgi:hypothetical protein
MTLDEVEKLLRLVAANDGRTTGEADAIIWTAAMQDLPYGDAEMAVLDHIREGSGWLTPADVRRGSLKVARRRRGLERQAQLGGPPGFCGTPGCGCKPPTQAEALEQGQRARAIGQSLAGVFRSPS